MNMKGISLSINMIVLIVIAVVVIVALVTFFTSSTVVTISDINANTVFSNGCIKYCVSDLYGTLQNVYDASKNDPAFVAACTKLGYLTAGPQYMNRCLDKCRNCDLSVKSQDTTNGWGVITNIAGRTGGV